MDEANLTQMKRETTTNLSRAKIVFLFDVDNTLLDNDKVIADLGKHLEREVGPERARCYWAIFERLRSRLGYADYLGALQGYRSEYPHDLGLLAVSRFLIDYPFANRLFPDSLDVVEHVKHWGPAVLLTDGNVVFQPRKVDRSGLSEAVDGQALIYVHKERELGRHRSPVSGGSLCYCGRQTADPCCRQETLASASDHIVSCARGTMPWIRRSGHHPAADVSVERIGDLLSFRLDELRPNHAKRTRGISQTSTVGAIANCTMLRQPSCNLQWLYIPWRSPTAAPKRLISPDMRGSSAGRTGWPPISYKRRKNLDDKNINVVVLNSQTVCRL